MTTIERMEKKREIETKYASLETHLNERTRRLWAATEATAIGYGGVRLVSEAVGIDRNTVMAGVREISDTDNAAPRGRIRRAGGGRKPLTETDTTVTEDLKRLVEPTERGDPESVLRWTTKSLENLTQALHDRHHTIGRMSVSKLLHAEGFSLQSNRKTEEGSNHPDRDAQFRYINESAKGMQTKNQPVISVDTKKKELIGNFKNSGQEWRKKGEPRTVNMHDFVDAKLGKVAPYGVYDLSRNEGWVNVGIDHDTASFAVESIRRWWTRMGMTRYPTAHALMLTADCGGSNANRNRLWKVELQKFADESHLTIHVRHFPPGTSKWNKIEHRLFSFISRNWRGRPLIDRATVVNLIAKTTTKTGLTVDAILDENVYPTGITISPKELNAVQLTRDDFHGEWNYSIAPRVLPQC